jgi:hypothetical protein
MPSLLKKIKIIMSGDKEKSLGATDKDPQHGQQENQANTFATIWFENGF